MARIYQDFAFDVAEVAGRPLVELCAAVDHNAPDDSPIVVFAHIDKPLECRRFFLGAGVAFWETWPDSVIADEHGDASVRLIRYFADVLPETIVRAHALGPAAEAAARIVIDLKNGVLVAELNCVL